jgi:hypothetical protein
MPSLCSLDNQAKNLPSFYRSTYCLRVRPFPGEGIALLGSKKAGPKICATIESGLTEKNCEQRTMKIRNVLACGIAIGLVQPLLLRAEDMFRLSWHGTAYTTGSSGQVTAKPFSERDFIQKVAADNGIDTRDLAFVYRPGAHDTVVVRMSDGWWADVIQMEYNFTQVSNSNQTKLVRQAFLFNDEQGSTAIGSAFGMETAKYNSDGSLMSDSFHGTFQYSIDGVLYSGTFSTGARVKDNSGN